MPLSGYFIATSLGLSGELAVGLILVASCPGGTASNMIAYIAKANLALAVITTMVSTVLGIVMTPLWCKLLAGQYVEVDALGMVLDMFLMVMIPVALGVFVNYKFPQLIKKMGQTGPVVSTWAIILISGGIIAPVDKGALIQHMGVLVVAASLLHIFGFGLGYAVPKLLKFDDKISKAISIETGMQNGGLAGILAKSHFPRMEQVNGAWMNVSLAPVPAVFCSIIQTIVGGIIGSIWRFTDKVDNHG
jgi:BASS family bile acid:Na+ symporter